MTASLAISHEDLRAEHFWRERFPALSISAPLAFDRYAPAMSLSDQDRVLHLARMAQEGYFQHQQPALAEVAPRLAAAAQTCVDMGLPPVFLFVFDEVWQCFYGLSPALTQFLGPQLCALPDFWFWHVDPGRDESGWSPHVDKGAHALDPQGRPLSLTAWIPLNEVTPLKSCMYVLPARHDPEYGVPTAERRVGFDVTKARALPGGPGDWFCWNQSVLHWGSASSPFVKEPRISMALEFQRGDIAPFNEPLIRAPEKLDFNARLWLVAKQVLQYRHMYALSPDVEAFATGLLSPQPA